MNSQDKDEKITKERYLELLLENDSLAKEIQFYKNRAEVLDSVATHFISKIDTNQTTKHKIIVYKNDWLTTTLISVATAILCIMGFIVL